MYPLLRIPATIACRYGLTNINTQTASAVPFIDMQNSILLTRSEGLQLFQFSKWIALIFALE